MKAIDSPISGILPAFVGPNSMKPMSGKTTGKRILLVEDERFTREALHHLLASDDHTVVEANNGAEAFTLFRTGQFDLVITDYEIPFVKGGELAAQIKRLAPRQPILMITAYPQLPGPGNPVDAVVNKPFAPAHFREVIADLLSRPGESFLNTAAAKSYIASAAFETEVITA